MERERERSHDIHVKRNHNQMNDKKKRLHIKITGLIHIHIHTYGSNCFLITMRKLFTSIGSFKYSMVLLFMCMASSSSRFFFLNSAVLHFLGIDSFCNFQLFLLLVFLFGEFCQTVLCAQFTIHTKKNGDEKKIQNRNSCHNFERVLRCC